MAAPRASLESSDRTAAGPEAEPAVATAPAASAPSTTSPPAPPTTPVPPPERRATLLFGGDVLTHLPVVRAAQLPGGGSDFTPMLAGVAPIVSAADVAVCHLEVPVSPDSSVVSGYPMFSAPAEVTPGLAASGFDGCSTASNHSLDRGLGGVAGTLESLDTWGLAHTGTGRSPEESDAPAWYDAAGIRVAQLSYTFGTNGIPVPADAPWSVRLIDPARIVADAQRVRDEGAEVVVVSLHWGTEYVAEPNAQQREVADAVTAAGVVDLVVGHHAHVPQPVERVNGTWVLFGLGNFVSNQSAGCCAEAAQDGAIATVEVAVGGPAGPGARVERVTVTPIRTDRSSGYLVVPVAEALAGSAPRGAFADDELRASWQRTAEVVARTPDPALVVTPAP